MKTLYLIMAAGKGKRWGNFKGVPKYMVEVDGEKLIDRTMRLLREEGENNIRVVTNNPELLSQEWAYFARNETGKEIDRFINCLPLISYHKKEFDEFCFLYGDVFYTKEAIEKIVVHPSHPGRYKGFKAFGRVTAFSQYGKSWGGGELFGLKIRATDIGKFNNALAAVNKEGVRNYGTGWLVYRALEGIPLERHTVGPEFVHIHDFTNDFDSPKDYRQWIKLWEHHNKKKGK